jgi:hypothetical protein
MSTGGMLNEIDWRRSEKNCISLNKGLIGYGIPLFYQNKLFLYSSINRPLLGVPHDRRLNHQVLLHCSIPFKGNHPFSWLQSHSGL